MTQEDKELLIKDLCARLPYGVKAKVLNEDILRYDYYSKEGGFIKGIENINDGLFVIECRKDGYVLSYDEFKPYLFPLSSLTEEQRNYISKLLIDTQNEFPPYGELNAKGCDNLFVCSVKQANVLINYCLANHLDINGLIEKGLAIDATGLDVY